ncbi:MAG: methionyl-tRNA formyltransferase [Candidatus Portnoybacteria bacterium]|nr:methionyl-tRNA formyltransferase [Candidatus Portnoybacteria bacterium]
MPSTIQPKTHLVNREPETLTAPQKQTQNMEDLKVVFMGTPEFAVPILEELIKSDFKPRAIITAPDKPVGRNLNLTPPPVKVLVQENNIPIFQPETKDELISQTSELKPDLIIVAAYGKILSREILNLPKYGSINVHPSILPKHRGPSPIQFAILNGDPKTGVTIMLMNEKMDEGPILSQEIVKITKDETAKTLEEKLSLKGAKLLIKTLKQWIALEEMPETAKKLIYPQEQDNSQATYTKIITKQDGKILWDKNAKELEQQIRAFYPWPGSFTFLKQNGHKVQNIKILKADILELNTEKDLGAFFLTENKKLAVQTGKDCLIIEELQPENGKPMSASNFLNGHPEIIGTTLE